MDRNQKSKMEIEIEKLKTRIDLKIQVEIVKWKRKFSDLEKELKLQKIDKKFLREYSEFLNHII